MKSAETELAGLVYRPGSDEYNGGIDMKDAINLNLGVDVYFGYNENDLSQINCVVSKVYEKAADYNIDVTSDVITNVATGRQELVFNFRKKSHEQPPFSR